MPKKIKKRSARPASEETDALLEQDGAAVEDSDAVEDDEDEVIDAEFDGDEDDEDEAPHSLADELLEEVPAAERDAFHQASYKAASWTEQHGSTVGIAVLVAIVVGLGALGYKQWSASQAVTHSAQVSKAIKSYATLVEGSQQEAMLKQLRKAFPGKWIETVDERFTSRMAQQTLLQSGKGRTARREKGQLDRISATIILQDWLTRKG